MSDWARDIRIRLKFLAHIEMGQSPPSASYSPSPDDGIPFLQGTADFGREYPQPRVFCGAPAKTAAAGDILFSVRAPVGELNIANQALGIGRGLCSVRPGFRLDTRFAWWALHEARTQLNYVASGSTYEAVSAEDVADLRLPEQPFHVQQAIARFLDREVARLDGLVKAKKRMIDLLAEKRRTLITAAVTRGLNLEVPFRDSDIPWLGRIPKHWKTRRLAFLFRERHERGEPDLPLLEVSINAGVVLREFSEDRIETTAADFNTYKVARTDDVVFNKMRMWQGAVGVAPQDGLVSPDYTVAASRGDLSSSYAGLLFRTEIFSAECARHSHGIVWDRLRLYWDGFKDILVPVPPQDEQEAIVTDIELEITKLDALYVATERTVSLLRERRVALIAAAVTGELEVD
ncbi:MAG: restriction endonuclease subunit S [Pseudomonadota bacterium]